MAVLEIQANGDTAVSKEAIVNAGQSLEDPLMRVSVKNTLCPKYTAVRTQKQGDKDELFHHCSVNTGLHTSPCFDGFISCHIQRFCAVFGVNMYVKHASDQIQNTQRDASSTGSRCSVAWLHVGLSVSLLPAGVHTVLFASRSQAPSYGSRPSVPPSPVRGPLPQTARRPLPHQQPVWVSRLHTPSSTAPKVSSLWWYSLVTTHSRSFLSLIYRGIYTKYLPV